MGINEKMKELGHITAQRREELEMSQEATVDFASESVGVRTLSSFECGKGNIGLRKLIALLDVLGMDLKIQVRNTVPDGR